MQISKNGLTLHRSENKRFQTGTIVFVDTKRIMDFHEEFSGKDSSHAVPQVSKTDWQTLQMEIEDPFENLLRFNEAISK